jgi:hypothetical protein
MVCAILARLTAATRKRQSFVAIHHGILKRSEPTDCNASSQRPDQILTQIEGGISKE